MTVIEGNRIIAKFMGITPIPAGTQSIGTIAAPHVSEAFLKYDSSWDGLMPVIEKIEHLYNDSLEVIVSSNKCWIELATQYALAYDVHLPSEFLNREDTKLESAYKTVVEFILFYNAATTS